MIVSELISHLQKLPQDKNVGYIWDGAARSNAEVVWESKGGDVMICGFGEVVYNDCDRPVDAPNEEDAPYWKSPKGDIVHL